jgi:phosphopentomutase
MGRRLRQRDGFTGAWGAAREQSTGKDTQSGHWEIAGVPVLFDWGYFPKTVPSFPKELTDKLQELTGVPGWLGNCHASGTTIIDELGDEHVATGKPISTPRPTRCCRSPRTKSTSASSACTKSAKRPMNWSSPTTSAA